MATQVAEGGFRRIFSGANGFMVAALASATIILVAAAAIGARDLSDAGRSAESLTGEGPGALADDGVLDYGDVVDPEPTTTDPDGPRGTRGGTGGPGAGGEAGGPGEAGPGGPGEEGSDLGAQAGGPLDRGPRQGVHRGHFEWGVHAPVTLNGAPLNIAEDFLIGLKGYVTRMNLDGGVNGRKVRLFITDDKYTTNGGKESRDKIVGEIKPFFIGGTLGVDQIHIVALGARQSGIPYFAGGGPEPEWGPEGEDVGMYQVLSNYDQYMRLLVDYICRYGQEYVGEEVRLGTTTLDSPFILPVEERFVAELEKRKCVQTPVDDQARGTIDKPDQQTTYATQLANLSSAYDGLGANLVVPLQDPVSTSRQVQELRAYKGRYEPKWTFNNFVHDADTTLALMGGDWTGVRGVSGGCYYLSETAYNPDLCSQMNVAHEQWVNLGPVTYDENAGGCGGGNCDYDYNEETWRGDGQGGSAGYQLAHFWLGAMKQIGTDPTRPNFTSALEGYDSYSDLVTGPISFKGSPNRMIGAYGGVIYEGQSNLKYRQVTEITPGLVDHF